MPFFRRTGKLLVLSVRGIAQASLTLFRRLPECLVRTGALARADAVLVPAGDCNGDRITKGVDLVKQGYAPLVPVSGPMPVPGVDEATLTIDSAVSPGYPAGIFVPLVSNSFSTRQEVNFAGSAPRIPGVHRVLVVTSNFPTRRDARRLGADADLRGIGTRHLDTAQLYPGCKTDQAETDLRGIGARHPNFTPDGWRKHREGRKMFFFEWPNTIATVFGL